MNSHARPSEPGPSRAASKSARSPLLAALVVLLLWTPSALGQRSVVHDVSNPRDVFVVEVSPRQLRQVMRVLRLGTDEASAAETLYAGHRAELARRSRAARAAVMRTLDEAQGMSDRTLFEAANREQRVWERETAALRASFKADLRDLLTPDQDSRWPMAERELRRTSHMGRGRLSGESLDLVDLCDEMPESIWESPGAGAALESYSASLDRLLLERDRLTHVPPLGFHQLVASDPPAAKARFEEGVRARIAVRDHNLRSARLIADELPPPLSERFRTLAFERSFLPLKQLVRVDDAAARALALPSLTQDQRAEITGVMTARVPRLAAWRERAAAELLVAEPTVLPSRLAAALGVAIDPSDPLDWSKSSQVLLSTALRRERIDLDRPLRECLDRVLTPEQLDEADGPDARKVIFVNPAPERP